MWGSVVYCLSSDSVTVNVSVVVGQMFASMHLGCFFPAEFLSVLSEILVTSHSVLMAWCLLGLSCSSLMFAWSIVHLSCLRSDRETIVVKVVLMFLDVVLMKERKISK